MSSNEFQRPGLSATECVEPCLALFCEGGSENRSRSVTRGLGNESAADTQRTLGGAEC